MRDENYPMRNSTWSSDHPRFSQDFQTVEQLCIPSGTDLFPVYSQYEEEESYEVKSSLLHTQLDLLPNGISERPSLREPSARRDEGVDEHPQPKNNAAIGFCWPELENNSSETALFPKPNPFRFGKNFWQTV
jgi:hypothetical protein